VDLLTAVSDQVALAIDRKRSQEETKRNEKITRTLFSISNAVNTTDNLDELYQSIYNSLNMLIELPNFFICIVDEEKMIMDFPLYIDEYDSDQTVFKTVDYSHDSHYITVDIIKSKKPLFLTESILKKRVDQGQLAGMVPKVWLGVPLIIRSKVIGVMVVQHYHDPDYFKQKDMDLLISVSDQVALALERKQYQEDLKNEIIERKRSTEINKILFAISNAVNTTLDLNELYKQIHVLLNKVIDATNFFIAIVDHNKSTVRFPYYVDQKDEDFETNMAFDLENTLTGMVILKRKPVLMDKKALSEKSATTASWGPPCLIWMGVPLIVRDNVIGVMAVQSYDDPDLYNKKDLEVFASISDQVAIAIDRKRTEDDLRESEKKYKHLFDSAPSGMFEIDFEENRFTEVNDVFCRYSGYLKEELLSMSPYNLFTGPSKRLFKEEYHKALGNEEVSNDIEYDMVGKDGQQLCVILNNDFIYEDSRLKGARVVVHNITERKKIENMIMQSEKMMSVGGLAAGMAHEINNPLAGMIQNSQVIYNRLSKEIPANNDVAQQLGLSMPAVKEYMERRGILTQLTSIHSAGSRAAKIIENMLGFVRKTDSIKAPGKLDEIMERTLALSKNDYNLKKKYDFRNIEIVKEYSPVVPTVTCEESKLQQVFFNIIKNASEAMAQSNESDHSPRIIIRLGQKSDMACIEIEDNGPGIDDETRKRLFEPFFTTKSVDKGTGLGLSVSYFIIVDDHKGKISVESIIGKGTKFTIELPV